MRKIKLNKKVLIITGSDKGKSGTVKKIMKNDKVIVEGINLRTKHQKPNAVLKTEGGIYKQEGPIHISNIKYID